MHINEVKINSFYQLPKWLFSEEYKKLSINAKILYTMLFNRVLLSKKNEWYDKDGQVYVYCTIDEIQSFLNIGRETAVKAKKELVNYKLIYEVRQGLSKPNRLYINRSSKLELQKYENRTSRSTKNSTLEVGKSNGSNTEYSNTEYSNTDIDIYSPVSDETRTTYLVEIKEAVSYLNSKAGTKYRHSADKTKKLIRARLKDGFTLNDIKKVIDKKVDEWLKTDMSKYLRPETLFGSKFESYLNQPEPEKSEYDDLF